MDHIGQLAMPHQICKKNSYFLTCDWCFTECITHIQDISILTELKILSSFLQIMPSDDNDVKQGENNTNKTEFKAKIVLMVVSLEKFHGI